MDEKKQDGEREAPIRKSVNRGKTYLPQIEADRYKLSSGPMAAPAIPNSAQVRVPEVVAEPIWKTLNDFQEIRRLSKNFWQPMSAARQSRR